jgi:hypothetical protein
MVERDDNVSPASPPQTKGELLPKIQAGFESMMAAVAPLDDRAIEEAQIEGDWSVKDNLAHIAAWEDVLVRFQIGGEPFESVVGMAGAKYQDTPFDDINEIFYNRDKGLSVSDVMARLRASHRAVLDALDRLTDAELARPRAWLDTPDAPSGPLSQYIAWNTYEHYAEHLAMIEALAEKG